MTGTIHTLREAYRRFKSSSRMDTLVAVALVLSLAASVYAVLRGDRRRGR